jgi:hypothetical protein
MFEHTMLVAAVLSLSTPTADHAPKRSIQVPGHDVILELWTEKDAAGRSVPHYAIGKGAIGNGAGDFSADRATSYTIHLRHGAFDPLGDAPAPAVAPELASGADTSLHLVQFLTQPLPEFREVIAEHGGIVRSYIPNHVHVVEMDEATRDAVAALPFVRWVGPFHPAYRVEEHVFLDAADARASLPVTRYNIMVFEAGMEQKRTIADRIEVLGGVVDRVHAGKFLLEATLTAEQLFQVARWNEVVFIDRWGAYETDMDLIRQVSGANYIEAVAGYTGAGVRGEVLDSGFNVSHGDFAHHPLILHTPVSTSGHGASTSGIVFGDGTGNPQARGMMPEGQGIIADSGEAFTGPPRYDLSGELVQAPYFAVFQTASVGSPRTTTYTSISSDTDAMIFDFDFVHLQSQSNSGGVLSRPQAWAKNIISVGGIRSQNTQTPTDDCWCGFASTGPASDGRVKPDLSHFNDSTFTTTCCGTASYTGTFGGTSGSTPIVAGHVGLVYQMWADGIFGNPVSGGTVFEERAHAATAKALLINTVRPYAFSGATHDLRRTHQGWGLPSLGDLYDERDLLFIIDETEILPNLGSVAYELEAVGGRPFRATLVYADPPGTPGSSVHRINDLSLKVTSPSGTVYWGNVGLLTGNESIPGGSPNLVDTVENVWIEDPEPGTWTVEVFADEVNQDSHVETPELDADFALVVRGVDPGPACPGDVDGDEDVDFDDLLAILAEWGPCVACPEDIDGDGVVGFQDLLVVLAGWGPC